MLSRICFCSFNLSVSFGVREKEREMSGFAFYSMLAVLIIWMLEKLLVIFWWKPRKIQKLFLDQGINGPEYRPFIGSLGELAKIYANAAAAQLSVQTNKANLLSNPIHLAFPYLPIWREKYGKVYLYWYGRIPRLSISDPDLIKEFVSTPVRYHQSIPHPIVYNLLAKSIVASGGEQWSTQRRLLKPFFRIESLKGLPSLVLNAVEEKIDMWKNLIKSEELEIEIDREFVDLSQYIIAKVIFGNDIDEGLQIIRLQSEQAEIASKTVKIFYIPGTRFIPTALHRRSKWLRREVEKKFHVLIERRLQCVNPKENDWISLMLSSGNMTRQQIIDQCGVFLIAGSESTGILLAWACLHLGSHKIWQEKAREEIQQVLLKDKRPIVEILSQFKILNMIIHETLRLYPSAPFVMKHSQENIKLGGLSIPAGIDIVVPIIAVHQDTTIWGHNATQFDPGRFSEGISKASKHPLAFMPFMQGPRICMGINFAMTEARVILAMILLNFDITISPRYKHVPVGGITLQLGHGAVLLLRKI